MNEVRERMSIKINYCIGYVDLKSKLRNSMCRYLLLQHCSYLVSFLFDDATSSTLSVSQPLPPFPPPREKKD